MEDEDGLTDGLKLLCDRENSAITVEKTNKMISTPTLSLLFYAKQKRHFKFKQKK